MKSILVDGYNLSLKEGTGVASYARDLCQAIKAADMKVDLLYETRSKASDSKTLKEIDLFDPIKEDTVVRQAKKIFQFHKLMFSPTAELFDEMNIVINKGLPNNIPDHDRLFGIQNGFKTSIKIFETFRKGVDIKFLESPPTIAHWTYPLPVKSKKSRNLYTLHDLVPLILPYTTGDKKRSYWRLVKWIADTADGIVTVSETSKNDIVKLLNVPEQKIIVTYQSAGHLSRNLSLKPEDISNFIESSFEIDYKKYFLFYSAIEPKKNVARLIDAYLQSGTNFPLVIVGKNGFKVDEELRLLEYFSRNDFGRYDVKAGRGRIIRVPYINRQALAMLVSGATAVTFPSLYEGFGLPIVEAMQLGTAVITSKGGATEEIAGNAAYLVDAYDTNSIALGLRTLGIDESTRIHHEKKGIERAKFFSFENYVLRLKNLYSNFT